MTRILNGSDAHFYDLFATGLDGDVSFYVEEALKAGGQVLELGCGTGRVLIPIAESGVSIVGLDNSTEMLEVAKRKVAQLSDITRRIIRFVEGDMRTFRLDEHFDLVIIPYRAFLHMMTMDDQRNALLRIRDHLVDRGLLIFNVYDPSADDISANSKPIRGTPKFLNLFRDHEKGRQVLVRESRHFRPHEQTLEWHLLYEELDKEGEVISKSCVPILQRYVHRFEMQYLLELCGFEVEALYGDFQRSPFGHGNEQVWVARKTCDA